MNSLLPAEEGVLLAVEAGELAALLACQPYPPRPPRPPRPKPPRRPSPHRRSGKPCRHCGASHVTRPKGLCGTCYYTPGVRQLYPSAARPHGHGVTRPHDARPLPDHPTTALPGSPEKIAVLEQRAALGVALWHPLDSRRPD
jgi:hypothetical protein